MSDPIIQMTNVNKWYGDYHALTNINFTVNKGDKIVIFNVGAYSVTQWMQFITLRPNVVMIFEDKTAEIIREAENMEYITSLERMPERLR